ncbi:MAG: S41 family peptidase [Alloprevotella sp.]
MQNVISRIKDRMVSLAMVLVTTLAMASCVTEEVAPNTIRGNFDALWQTLDERYCFFDLKAAEYGLDWNEVYARYQPKLAEQKTLWDYFNLLEDVVCELRDGHVNIISSLGTARYGEWFDNYPANYADTLERKYLGRTTDYVTTGGLKYRVLSDSIAYVRCPSFDVSFGDGNLHVMMLTLAPCKGMILDIRSNGGGRLTSAEKLASVFIEEKTVGGYMAHKTGKGHNDFSQPEAIEIEPFSGRRWTKPLVVLTNRRTYSAANAFVMYVKGLPGVTIVGDKTGGGSGMPLTSELPCGWTLRFSACPMYDRQMALTEEGIAPDVKVDITSDDYRRDIDTIIETARLIILSADN